MKETARIPVPLNQHRFWRIERRLPQHPQTNLRSMVCDWVYEQQTKEV